MAAYAQQSKDYLSSELPQELLDQVLGYLDFSNQLKLRRVFRKDIYDVRVVPVIKPVLSILCVSPSRVSLRNFQRICHTRFFQDHIKCVIYSPNAISADSILDWDLAETTELFEVETTAVERYRERVRTRYGLGPEIELTGQEALRSYALYCSLHEEHEAVEDKITVLAILEGGFLALSNLNEIRISYCFCNEGSNVSSLLLGWSCQMGRSSCWNTMEDGSVEQAACILLEDSMNDYHSDVLFQAIGNSKIALQKLQIGTRQVPIAGIEFGEDMMRNAVRNLRILTICCEDYPDWRYLRDFERLWEDIAMSVSELHELTLIIEWDRPIIPTADRVHHYFLESADCPNLRALRMQPSDDGDLPPVDSQALRRFLIRHSDSLREVELENVLIHQNIEDEDVCESLRAFLDTAFDPLRKLESAIVRILRPAKHSGRKYDCHPRATSPKPCDGACEMYEIPGHPNAHAYNGPLSKWLSMEKLEALAGKLGVELKDGAWDFGEYVMKRLA